MSQKTPHKCNPILYAARAGADYATCRTCRGCLVLLAAEFPAGVLTRDMGLCAADGMSYVDLDEPRAGDDAECWAPR